MLQRAEMELGPHDPGPGARGPLERHLLPELLRRGLLLRADPLNSEGSSPSARQHRRRPRPRRASPLQTGNGRCWSSRSRRFRGASSDESRLVAVAIMCGRRIRPAFFVPRLQSSESCVTKIRCFLSIDSIRVASWQENAVVFVICASTESLTGITSVIRSTTHTSLALAVET